MSRGQQPSRLDAAPRPLLSPGLGIAGPGRVLAGAAGVAGLVLLAVLSVSGPLDVVTLPDQLARQSGRPARQQLPDSNSWDYWTGVGEPTELSSAVSVVSMIVIVAAVALVVGVVGRWIYRWVRATRPDQVQPSANDEQRGWDRALAASSMAGAVDDATAAIRTPGVGEGIVACWQSLETAAGAVGVPRHPSETSTEFTLRLLAELQVQTEPVERLAALFREARFSRHPMDQSSRQTARDALLDIRHDLVAGESGQLGVSHRA
ncbi:MAG: hypothetical protein QOF52_1345 [Propionibacteriaceae bacterium]|nr:hypothetical protein [Propionibacteriaceae bacterium]